MLQIGNRKSQRLISGNITAVVNCRIMFYFSVLLKDRQVEETRLCDFSTGPFRETRVQRKYNPLTALPKQIHR
jgi:hypothetical protein